MRKRVLSPGFFENPDLSELEPRARLLFAGLWCVADREGRLTDDVRRIRAAVFPYEPTLDVSALIAALAAAGFLIRYKAGGEGVIWIPTFLDHQQPHIRETPSRLPVYVPRSTEGEPKADLGIAKASPRLPVSVPVPESVPESESVPDSVTVSESNPPRGKVLTIEDVD